MAQLTFGDVEYSGKGKTTRQERLLAEMEQVVPWSSVLVVIASFYPEARNGRRPYPLATMLRVYLMQNWLSLSDPGMENALYDVPALHQFAGLSSLDAIPDETTILNFRHLIEQNDLAPEIFGSVRRLLQRKGLMRNEGTMVDATIIDALTSTKNEDGKRAPEMHQTKKGNDWHFGIKAHIGVDVDSGLTHTVVTTAANEADVAQVAYLLHGKEQTVHGDAGYLGSEKHAERADVEWVIAKRRGTMQKIANARERARAIAAEKRKASVRAFVEHPFRIEKYVFGFRKVRFEGLAKDTTQLLTLFAPANLYQARRRSMVLAANVRPQFG